MRKSTFSPFLGAKKGMSASAPPRAGRIPSRLPSESSPDPLGPSLRAPQSSRQMRPNGNRAQRRQGPAAVVRGARRDKPRLPWRLAPHFTLGRPLAVRRATAR
jgi:hypothetical protein